MVILLGCQVILIGAKSMAIHREPQDVANYQLFSPCDNGLEHQHKMTAVEAASSTGANRKCLMQF